MAFPDYEQPVDHDAEAAEQARIEAEVKAQEAEQVAGTPAETSDAESTPDATDTVTVSLAADAANEDGEPLVELSVAGVSLKPGEDAVELTRAEAAVFAEDERVTVEEVSA